MHVCSLAEVCGGGMLVAIMCHYANEFGAPFSVFFMPVRLREIRLEYSVRAKERFFLCRK